MCRTTTPGSNQEDPDPLKSLPPEIFDKILEFIPATRDGRPTLIACALVATWWTAPSQRRLFSSISIHEANLQRWMDGVALSESKSHLLAYARSLWHWRGGLFGDNYRMRNLPQDSCQYSSALHNVQNLTLVNFGIEDIGGEGFRTCFSAFRETLTFLYLEFSGTSFSAFVTLVNYFPNITALRLRGVKLEPDEGPVPTLSRPLRGKIYIEYSHHPGIDCLEFFRRLAKLDLEYEEVVVNFFSLTSSMGIDLLESVLQISPTTIKFLRLLKLEGE